jgi:diacylglycerol kinase (ATP)
METGRHTRGRRDRVVLITGAHAGHINAGGTPAGLLRRVGIEVTHELSVEEIAQMAPAGRRWKRYGVAAVVAAGGDGTVGAAAAQVAGSDLPLGILPLGTSNDVARALGTPLDLEQAAATILEGIPTTVDVGVAKPQDAEAAAASVRSLGELAGRLLGGFLSRRPPLTFLHAATLGLNVEFARLASDAARRERLGQFTYAASTLEALAKVQPVPVTLRLSGVRGPTPEGGESSVRRELVVTCNALQLAVVNTPVFGGPLNLRVPGVVATDRLLDFLLIEAPEPRHLREAAEALLSAFARLGEDAATGTSARIDTDDVAQAAASARDKAPGAILPGVRRFQARAGRIETPTAVDVTLDGEIRARTPVEITVARRPLWVLLPQEAQRERVGAAVSAAHVPDSAV